MDWATMTLLRLIAFVLMAGLVYFLLHVWRERRRELRVKRMIERIRR